MLPLPAREVWVPQPPLLPRGWSGETEAPRGEGRRGTRIEAGVGRGCLGDRRTPGKALSAI